VEILALILQGLLGLTFLMAGVSKISGSKMQVESFKQLRLPQWFRVVTGIVQLAATIALIIGFWEPSWAAAGALLLGFVAIGGILAHVRVKDSLKQTLPILILGVLSFILFFIRLSDLSDFPGFN